MFPAVHRREGRLYGIRRILRIKPIWLMDVDYDIVFKGAKTRRRPSDVTQPDLRKSLQGGVTEHT